MMSEQLQGRELDVALARALGLETLEGEIRVFQDDGFIIKYFTAKHYSTDLNAMHEVEAELDRRGLRSRYARALVSSIGLDDMMFIERDAVEAIPPAFGFDIVWYPAHATAEQRARAALAVLTK